MKFQDQIIFGVFTFLTVINLAHSLRCYKCSSDAINGEFCKDPFKRDHLTNEQRSWSEKECKSPGGSISTGSVHFKPVCKKMVQEVNGVEVIQRQCYFQDVHDSYDRCAHEETVAYVKTKFCQTCDTDYCNSSGIFAPVFFLVMLPALIAKIFTL